MSNRLAPKKRTLGRDIWFQISHSLPVLRYCPNSLFPPSPKQQGLENFNDIRQGTFKARGLTTGGKMSSANGS